MVEDKKVLLGKEDTLKNIADSLTKSVSTEKFSWCRKTMGVAGLDQWLISLVAPYGKKTISGRMFGVCYILSMTTPRTGGPLGEWESPTCTLHCA